MWEFSAPKSDRLDRLLREQSTSPWMSRQAWEEAISLGFVSVNGKRIKKSGEAVAAEALIKIDLPELGLLPAESAPLNPIGPLWRQGDELAVFDKPAGMPSYPLYPWERGTFANQVARFAKDELGLEDFSALAAPPILEGGLLQRLDTHTSGLLTVAFTKEAKALYRKVFSGQVTKKYLAIVAGAPSSGDVFFPQSSGAKVLARLAGKEGDEKVKLGVKIVARAEGFSLVEVSTSQGLRHVVRAGMAALGAPLVGDALYGGSALAPYHQLHAQSLLIPGFSEISSSPPQTFLACAQKLGLHYKG